MTRDLIVFGEDWGGLPSSTQHLIGYLGEGRKVLWVNSIGLRKPKLNWMDMRRVGSKVWKKIKVTKIAGTGSNNDTLSTNFSVLNPITIPAPESKLARRIAGRVLAKQVLPFAEKMHLNNPVFWTSLPTSVDFQQHLKNMPSLYYCGDDFAALNGVDHKVVQAHEADLVKKTNLIVTASEILKNKFPEEKTRLLTHGVDCALFQQIQKKASDFPNNGKPCAGFYGSLSAWLDQNLLSEVIISNPGWNFIFIGQEHVDLSRLKCLHNAYFLGPKPHKQLPSYSQHWDVSLLPFTINSQIIACNPLKLKEYLAVGKPIISTDFPAARRYAKHINIVTSSSELISILQNYRGPDLIQEQSRKLSMHNESWLSKAKQLSEWIEAL